MFYRSIIISLAILTVSCGQAGDSKGELSPGTEESQGRFREPSKETITLTESQIRNGGIQTGLPEQKSLNSVLQVNGSIDVPPQNIVSVSFPFGGYLKTTILLPGMRVRKGEVIGVMEDQALVQLQQDYLVAQARLKYLQLEFERQRTLQESNVNSAKTLQQTEADFNSQKVLVSGFASKLRMIRINPESLNESRISSTVPLYSPIDGFVSKVNVNIGKFVNATDVLFELINPEDMHAALTVFEKDISKVRKGQKVSVSLVDDPAHIYDCEVILVTRNVDQDRTGTVHCHFEKMPASLLPGMFLNAKIMLSETSALTVPEDAVVRFGNGQFIMQEEEKNSFRMIAVNTGIREKGNIQIHDSAGKLAGRMVVVKNAYAVLSSIKNVE